jgi:hypothetical protein
MRIVSEMKRNTIFREELKMEKFLFACLMCALCVPVLAGERPGLIDAAPGMGRFPNVGRRCIY